MFIARALVGAALEVPAQVKPKGDNPDMSADLPVGLARHSDPTGYRKAGQ